MRIPYLPPLRRLGRVASGVLAIRSFRASVRALPLLLILLLPLFQLGGVLHGIGHLSDPRRTETADLSKDACALCAAYAMADSVLPGATPALPVIQVAGVPDDTILFSTQTATYRVYLARAPPDRLLLT